MYPASLIADVFVRLGIQEGQPLTQMKVQKMVFFAQGYHLAKYGKPLVQENIKAWKFGPVIPRIYDDYVMYGSNNIVDTGLSKYRDSSDQNILKLDEHAREAIEYTWEATKDVSAIALSNWTHQPGSPWSQYYDAVNWGKTIKSESIQHYFKQFLFDSAAEEAHD